MRLKLILCKVMQREAYLCASRCPHIIDIVLMPQGLHNTPQLLRQQVQLELDNTVDPAGRAYDAILLGYGLCSNGIAGLKSAVPVVVARGHDCMTLLLGSRQRYQDYFDAHKGIYWYSLGWIEHSDMPSKERLEKLLAEYTEKYGQDNAEYLISLEQTWIKEYRRATFIDWGLPGSEEAKAYTRKCAEYLKWEFDEIQGDSGLMQRLVDGNWNDEDFLLVPPGHIIVDDLTQPCLMKAQQHCTQRGSGGTPE
ncbi:MAG: DUF1638 domain-containing protein [Planctomycetaceae bacterium]|nr:DUF1638 domain-containing protein [Planctomycetaceae bacterium]